MPKHKYAWPSGGDWQRCPDSGTVLPCSKDKTSWQNRMGKSKDLTRVLNPPDRPGGLVAFAFKKLTPQRDLSSSLPLCIEFQASPYYANNKPCFCNLDFSGFWWSHWGLWSGHNNWTYRHNLLIHFIPSILLHSCSARADAEASLHVWGHFSKVAL